MSTHQIHFSRKFYQDKHTGYWISTDYPRIRAHQWVWVKVHGPIPKGYHIHHKDDNKSNNVICNLELIEKSRHLKHHLNDPRRIEIAKRVCDQIRPLTKEWHRSEEGKAWHRYHAAKIRFGNNIPHEETCQNCAKKYQTKKIGRNKFCSNNCRSQARRNSGVDDIEGNCVVCYKKFTYNKYQTKTTCGIKCRDLCRRQTLMARGVSSAHTKTQEEGIH